MSPDGVHGAVRPPHKRHPFRSREQQRTLPPDYPFWLTAWLDMGWTAEMLRSVVFAIALFASVSEVAAFCSEPRAPGAPRVSPPSPPYCGSFGDLSGCERWEIDSYRNEVNAFIEEMQFYSDEAAAFASRARDFAQCMADEAINEWNRFVGY